MFQVAQKIRSHWFSSFMKLQSVLVETQQPNVVEVMPRNVRVDLAGRAGSSSFQKIATRVVVTL